MKINNRIIKTFLVLAVLSFGGCETIDLDQTENPSTVSADLLDPIYAFNYVQLQLPDFVDSANSFTQDVTRQMAMTGGNTYDNAFAPVNFNTNWSTAYNILNAVKLMEPKAIENNQTYILGATRVIRCYVLMTLTDIYGDIPVSEALLGNENLTPRYDKSVDVYKQVLRELDEAIVTLQSPGEDKDITDLYYGGKGSWITLANTLKLKMYNNARLAGSDLGVDIGASITAIVNANDIIDTPEEDFAFKYGNSRFTPNTRHPLYNGQYEAGGGAYIGNYIMWAMTTEKYGTGAGPTTASSALSDPTYDPRTHFYFFKQIADPSSLDSFELPSRSRPDHYNDSKYSSFYLPGIGAPYSTSNWVGGSAVASGGFLGRDHGNNDGIPPDASSRTVGGIYPIGGAYGAPTDVQTGGDKGALGAGIMPILMSSFVQFIVAEAALEVNGFTADPRARFKLGMEQSINKVINFLPDYRPSTRPTLTALESQRDSYVAFMLQKYDELSSDDKRLEIIIKEYYIASWGNGMDPYNNYRRTGYPSNFQPTREAASGAFYSTAFYSGSSVNNNPNTPNNVRTRKVFWDKANINLH